MDIPQISAHLNQHQYCHTRDFCELIQAGADEEESFRGYWSNLVRDEAFRDYTHRERRLLRYRLLPSRQLQVDRNAEYRSSITYPIKYRQGVNVLNYCEDGFISHPVLWRLLAADIAVIAPQLGEREYSIDIHQFRVRADAQSSSPTTSGIHQDGLDWVFMHFIDARNTVPVVSEVFVTENTESCVLSLAMDRFLETIVIHDRVLYHRAGDVQQSVSSSPAWRDLLLVGFRRVPSGDEMLGS
jgi:hypothetical protein